LENWSYNNGICTNVTTVGGLQLSASSTASTVTIVNVVATVPSTYTVPLKSVQFRYVLATTGSSPQHWSGVVSTVQISSSNPQEVTLTFYPDQSVYPVPSQVTLNLLVIGMIQSGNGTWVPSIRSPELSDAGVFTLQLNPDPTPACVPTVGFAVNMALQLVPQLSNLTPALQKTVAVTSDASAQGLSNAGTVPFIVPKEAGLFAGAVVPLIATSSSSVTYMFVILAWTAVNNPTSPVIYVVKKNNVTVYSGPLTVLVDAVSVNATNSVTYSVQAQTLSNPNCTSQPQFTTCPPLQYQGAMCTSIQNGSFGVLNFMIPDPTGSGCTNILPGDETNAAYYACVYLRNKDRSMAGIQVPAGDNSQCMSIVPVNNGTMVQPLNQNEDANGNPVGYCNGVPCAQGFSNLSRSAVCACGGNATLCKEQKDDLQGGLPYLQLQGLNGQTEGRSARDFGSGFNGMAGFLQRNPNLQF
jgi:hypothetical protein